MRAISRVVVVPALLIAATAAAQPLLHPNSFARTAERPSCALSRPRSSFPSSPQEAALDQTLRQAIAALNPAAAQIVILRYVHDYSLADIARMLGTTRSTVAVSLYRSRSRLKKYFSATRKGGDHAV